MNVGGQSCNHRFETKPLGKGIEHHVPAIAEQFSKLGILVGRCVDVDFLAEFFVAETRFVQGTGRDSCKILADQREHAEHGKALEGHDDLAAGALLNAVQHLQIAFQRRFIDR